MCKMRAKIKSPRHNEKINKQLTKLIPTKYFSSGVVILL